MGIDSIKDSFKYILDSGSLEVQLFGISIRVVNYDFQVTQRAYVQMNE